MREAQWIEWTRTGLLPREGAELLADLTSEQQAHLLEHDYVFAEGIGVLWRPAGDGLRRARFTHGAHFGTARGEFYIDAEGSVRELPGAEAAEKAGKLRPLDLFRDRIIREDPVLAVGEHA